MQRTLLTKELDDALNWYDNPRELEESLHLSGFDPQAFLRKNASLALIEAASKNELDYVKRLVNVRSMPGSSSIGLISLDDYYESVYFALVAAAQSGHKGVFDLYFNEHRMMIVAYADGMTRANTNGVIPARFETMDFTKAAEVQGTLSKRMGLQNFPNVMIEAASYGRLDMVKTLLRFIPLPFAKNPSDQYGYYPCLRAAEAGHVAVMEEFLHYQNVCKKILSNGDALRFVTNNDDNPVGAVFKKLNLVPAKSIEAAKPALSRSGSLFAKSESSVTPTVTEQQSSAEHTCRF